MDEVKKESGRRWGEKEQGREERDGKKDKECGGRRQVCKKRREVKDKRIDSVIKVRKGREGVGVGWGVHFHTSVVCSSGPAGKRGPEEL